MNQKPGEVWLADLGLAAKTGYYVRVLAKHVSLC